MENILKKIAEFDKVNETKLAKHKVELGLIDDLNKLLSTDQGANYYSDYKVMIMKLIDEGKKFNYKIESEMKKINEVLNEISNQSKQLGLNANDIPAFKKANGILNSYKERINTINEIIANINKTGY